MRRAVLRSRHLAPGEHAVWAMCGGGMGHGLHTLTECFVASQAVVARGRGGHGEALLL